MGQVVSMSDHKKRKRRRGGFRWMRIIFFCLVCMIIGFGISQSSLFHVKNIEVVGNSHVDSALIRDLSGITEGQHMYSFRAGRAETMIATNPWVDTVEVSRSLSGTVTISITERTAAAAVVAGNGVLIVDKNGYVLQKQELFDGLSHVLIIGVDDWRDGSDVDAEAAVAPDGETTTDEETTATDTENSEEDAAEPRESPADEQKTESAADGQTEETAEEAAEAAAEQQRQEATAADQEAYSAAIDYQSVMIGQKLNSEKLAAGLAVAETMPQEAMDIVTQMNVLDPQNIILDTVYGIKIYFGDQENTEKKFAVADRILADENKKGTMTKINYIDVSVPSHPALRYNN